ncbi:MAG TPA: hypothetical protein VKW76_09740 [Candidatus Binatia bacterium]|nr:hypothetical protein [Candidatus Binatia bacterium]
MSSSERITRPHPRRSEPIRTFRGTSSEPPAAAAAERPRASVGEAVAHAVDLGYRVLDEYLQQGQRAARGLGLGPDRAEAAVDDLQALATRMARYTSDFLGVWAQFVDVALSTGRLGGAKRNDAPPGPASAPAPTPARAAVAVRVRSPQAAEVAADLAADLAERPLTVQALRGADPTVPPITGVRFEPATAAQAARLHVVVPPEQAPGTYVGVVVDDETGRFAGTVTVTVVGTEG